MYFLIVTVVLIVDKFENSRKHKNEDHHYSATYKEKLWLNVIYPIEYQSYFDKIRVIEKYNLIITANIFIARKKEDIIY